MKGLIACAIALLVVASAAEAADVKTEKGTKAMVFEFSGLSDLGLSRYGAGIGMRYYFRDGLAIRPGLQFDWDSGTTKGVGGSSDEESSRLSIGINTTLEKHLPGPKSISPYLGTQLGFGYFKNVQEPSVPRPPTIGTLLKTTHKNTSFWVWGLLGFEWGFTESLTLGGEYQFGFDYNSGYREDERQSIATLKSDDKSSLEFNFWTAGLFLSVNW